MTLFPTKTAEDLRRLLQRLIASWEGEVVEFKQAGNDYSTDRIGKYFSALANEANLRSAECGWLVFGVHDKTRQVVGTDYRQDDARLDSLKMQIRDNAEPSISFRSIHVLDDADGRVLLFEIPAAPRGIPIAWNGHYYARAGESLTSLSLDKLDAIRGQTQALDWTAQQVEGATLDDLDDAAVRKARESFQLLMDKLSDALDERQKYNKISNLLTRLRRRGVIVNTGSDTAPCWRLTGEIAKRN